MKIYYRKQIYQNILRLYNYIIMHVHVIKLQENGYE